jgi:hypothetical protein
MCKELTDASQRISHGYSNTSSASTSSEGGTTRSSAFAFQNLLQGRIGRPYYRQIGWRFALQDAAHAAERVSWTPDKRHDYRSAKSDRSVPIPAVSGCSKMIAKGRHPSAA